MRARSAVALLVAAVALASNARAQRDTLTSAPASAFNKQRVTFKSGELTLVGYLFKPNGRGPFPLVVWNHGSEPNPGGGPQFDSVAAIFVPAGYVVFAPVRRGHVGSEGRYIQDEITAARERGGMDAAQRTMIRLHETEQLDDQLAGQAYARHVAGVDTTRMVVAGCSYGGIQTLLVAERGAGYKAAIPISPAALSWQFSPLLQERLVRAVAKIEIPVFLIQPMKRGMQLAGDEGGFADSTRGSPRFDRR